MDLNMTPGEAILVLGAIDDRAAAAFATWRKLIQTDAPEPEQEAAKSVAAILARVSARLGRTLYPVCEWMDNEECPMPVKQGHSYCAFHTARLANQRETAALLA